MTTEREALAEARAELRRLRARVEALTEAGNKLVETAEYWRRYADDEDAEAREAWKELTS